MAHLLAQTLRRTNGSFILLSRTTAPIHQGSKLLVLRNQSSVPEHAPPIDANLVDSSSSSLSTSSSDSEEQVREEALPMVQRIEEAIHGIIVRRSAPDWLPFRPGASYWVPPRKGSFGVSELVQKLANVCTEEESMALTTGRGWPSSEFFQKSASSQTPEVETAPENIVIVSQPGEEEE